MGGQSSATPKAEPRRGVARDHKKNQAAQVPVSEVRVSKERGRAEELEKSLAGVSIGEGLV